MAAVVKKVKPRETPEQEEATDIAEREARIAELAYLKAEKRGFEPGHEMEDWLEAEVELNQEELNKL